MDIFPLIKKDSGCDYHRLSLPLSYLGVDLDAVGETVLGEGLANSKLVLYNRVPPVELNDLLTYRKRYGFKIVVDLDDYWQLNENHTMQKQWVGLDMERRIKESLMNADYVTVTTKRLADKVMHYNPKVEVIPNALPMEDGQFGENRLESERFRILYAGGQTHLPDLFSISQTFKMLSNLPMNFEMRLAGYNDNNPQSKAIWDRMERIVTAGGRMKNYVRVNSLPLDSYMQHYMQADVSIAPLENREFNWYKSNLKVIEAGCMGIPIICSAVPPYTDEGSELVWMASNQKQWFELLRHCIKYPEKVREQGKKLQQYVTNNYNLYKVNETRKQLFHYLMTT